MAETGANVKIKVDGLSQFKKDMGAAKASIKTVESAMKLTEKQFQKTGDSEKYMTDKADLLQRKLDRQNEIIEKTKNALKEMKKQGVDMASESFQTMQQRLLDAETAATDTQIALDQLKKSGSKAGNAVKKMNDRLENIGKNVSIEAVVKGIDKITGGMEKATKKAVDLGQKIVKNVLGAGSWADDLATTASNYGISTEELQRMEKTAKIIDTDVDDIIKARQKLMKGVGTGDKGTLNTLSALGVSYNGDAEKTFWEAGEAIMKLGDEAEKEAKANELFGKSWHDLIPLFKTGKEEYDKVYNSWNVVSDEQLDVLTKMDDQYQALSANFETLKMQALSTFAEPMTKAMETLTTLMNTFMEQLNSEEGQKLVSEVIGKITDALQWIVDNKDSGIKAMEGIVLGWAGLKLTGGALQVLQVINGLKGLGLLGGVGSAAGGSGGLAAGAAAGAKALVTAGGGASLLAPLGVAGVALAPAALANASYEKNTAQKMASRLGSASLLNGTEGDFLARAAKALGGNVHGGNEAEIEAVLMGMANRTDLQKAQLYNMLKGATAGGNSTWNELQRLWGGEDMDMGRMTAILESVTDAYDRMAKAAEESNKNGTEANKNSLTSGDVTAFKGVPAAMETAVRNGMSGVRIYLDGREISSVVSHNLGGGVVALVQ